MKMVDQLHEIITGHEIPDAPEPVLQPNELPPAESLPDAKPSEIVGILEYLDAREGKEDVFKIATETEREFGEVIKVVKSAELLDFVDTPKRLVVLTPDGQRFVKATSQERQNIWKEQLLKLRLFKQVNEMLAKHPRARLDADLVQEIIIFNLPNENFEKTFETFIHWAMFGNLFAYDEDTQKIFYPRKRQYKPKPKTNGKSDGNGDSSVSSSGESPAEAPIKAEAPSVTAGAGEPAKKDELPKA
jgi:NitT/TauT family transport system ATP-binding protein